MHWAIASAYSRESSGPRNGCDGSELHDGDLSVATFLVPCGARVQICIGSRCVIVSMPGLKGTVSPFSSEPSPP